jgi:hypothetical protein
MRPAVLVGNFLGSDPLPSVNYDEQLILTFTQNFSSLVYNVTAVEQNDSYGYGPAYLLNGVTDKGYWYQVGLSFDDPGNGSYAAGFNFIYEVFNNSGNSVFPASGGGGLDSFNGTVNDGDNVLLNLYFSSGNVVMYAYDWNTSASAEETYAAVGASLFQGQTSTWVNANGFFTGLMTEWWHPNPYYGGEAEVVYTNASSALSSGWLCADEWVPSNGTTLFSQVQIVFFSNPVQYVSFSNPTQLNYFSTNGAVEAASGYLFITGGSVPLSPVTNVAPSKTVVGQGLSANISVTVANQGGYTETFSVTAYASFVVIGSENVTLQVGNSTTVTFTWNTTGFAYDNYTISAYAWPVPSENNTILIINSFTGGTLTVTIPGDINGDGSVDIYDAIALAKAYGSTPGSPNWNSNADINGDGIVDIYDAIILAANFGQSIPYYFTPGLSLAKQT